MKKSMVMVMVLLTAYVFAACHRYNVRQDSESDRKLLSDKIEGRKVELRLKNGHRFWARQVRLAADSTYWFDARLHKERKAATADVSRIVLRSHRFKVGLAGALSGGLIALALAGLAVAALEEDEVGEVSAGPLVAALYLIPINMVFGMVIGASHGVKHDYRFEEEIPNR